MSLIELDRRGREYITWPDATGIPTGATLEATIDGTTWVTMGTGPRVLVAGPDAADNPDGTLVAPIGVGTITVRLADSPEIVVRKAATVYVA